MNGLRLGPVGVALNVSDRYLDEAAQLERLGYAAIWLPGGQIDRARATARTSLRLLSGFQGYRQSFARMGFTVDDIAE
jgi:hypothetical protein